MLLQRHLLAVPTKTAVNAATYAAGNATAAYKAIGGSKSQRPDSFCDSFRPDFDFTYKAYWAIPLNFVHAAGKANTFSKFLSAVDAAVTAAGVAEQALEDGELACMLSLLPRTG